MSGRLISMLGAFVTLGRNPWHSPLTTADRLQTLALRRRLDQYL